MSHERGLLWKIVGVCSLAIATPAVGQESPGGLDEALSGQAPKRVEPKRGTPPLVLSPVFWSPSPRASAFVRELRQTKTKELPSADTPYPEADPKAPTFRSKNPVLSPERTVVYVALSDPAPGTNLDQRCVEIRAEIEAERLRIEKNGVLRGSEEIGAAASVNVWARHEGARLTRMLDPKSDVYQQRLLRMRARRGPGETDQQVEERLREQIRMQHLEQLLGTSAIEAELYRQRLPMLLAEKGPEETEQEIEERLRKEFRNEQPGRYGVGGKEDGVEKAALDFWPHRAASDCNARFEKLSHDLLYERNLRTSTSGRERLFHYIRARDPRLSYQDSRLVFGAGQHAKTAPQIYKDALELVRRERSADLLLRLSEMNAWETAGRGTPEAYRQVEALMNRALDTALPTNPRAKERERFYQTELHFAEGRAREAVRGEFKTEFLLRLCDTPRDRRSPEERALDKVLETDEEAQKRYEFLLTQPGFTKERAREKIKAEFKTTVEWRLEQRAAEGGTPDERDIPEAPLYPEYRVKQFVRENRLTSVTAAVDRLHSVLSPMAGQAPPTGEQVRDAVREALANRSPDEVEEFRDLYRARWLTGAKGKEPRDLDGEIYAKLGDNLEMRKQCEAFLHRPREKSKEGVN